MERGLLVRLRPRVGPRVFGSRNSGILEPLDNSTPSRFTVKAFPFSKNRVMFILDSKLTIPAVTASGG